MLDFDLIRRGIQDEPVETTWTARAGIQLSVRRFDLIHPLISGNKPFKLKGWLSQYREGQTIVSFGGAWSNHLVALAATCNYLKIPAVGIVRGEQVHPLNPAMSQMLKSGMKLYFVSRSAYREKERHEEIARIINKTGEVLLVPEGGGGLPGLQGATEMVDEHESFNWILLPGGTGTTAAGIATKLVNSSVRMLVFQALKGSSILHNEVRRHCGIELNSFRNLHVHEDFHFGGFAKYSEELAAFYQKWLHETGLFLDRVYGQKAMAGIKQLANNGFFSPGQRLLYIHTGGFNDLLHG